MRWLYETLEKITKAAVQGNAKEVGELNDTYNIIARDARLSMDSELFNSYDNCRQSAIFSVSPDYIEMRDKFLEDMNERFEGIRNAN